MMSGRFYIDGKDAFTEYGIYVQEGGYNELVAFPPLKAVTSNDWQEEDGIEPDLSEPTLNTKEFFLKNCSLRHGLPLGRLHRTIVRQSLSYV